MQKLCIRHERLPTCCAKLKRYCIGDVRNGSGFYPLDDAWLYSPTLWSIPLSNITDAIALIAVLGVLPRETAPGFGTFYTQVA